MTLRCKPGDLALVTRGENVGRLVTVKARSEHGATRWLVSPLGGPLRAVNLTTWAPCRTDAAHIEDARLRPLRDQDGTDEVLRIAQRTA